MSIPRISIIVLNYKSYKLTRECVRGLLHYLPGYPVEIIVVDNQSSPVALSKLEQQIKPVLEQVCSTPATVQMRYIANKNNIGYAAGNNIGIQQSQGEYILVLNPDTVVFEHTIAPLVAYLDQQPDVGMVGPRILNPDKTYQYTCCRFPDWKLPLFRRTILARTPAGKKWLDWYLMKDFDHEQSREVDWLFGACLLVRRQALEAVGLLDEQFFLFMEDTDWCYRFWQHGWKVAYEPNSELVHYIDRASKQPSIIASLRKKTAWIHISSWIKYYHKHIWRNADYQPTGR